jgi:hypothetical protein
MRRRTLLAMALGLSIILTTLTGCSRFDREWKRAAAASPEPGGIEGRWEGKWASINGHTGRLRCILSPAGEGEYLARFHATFWSICQAEYTVTLRGEQRDGAMRLAGEENLGWLAGGKFEYDADVDPERFVARYRSRYENGEFRMARPGSELHDE